MIEDDVTSNLLNDHNYSYSASLKYFYEIFIKLRSTGKVEFEFEEDNSLLLFFSDSFVLDKVKTKKAIENLKTYFEFFTYEDQSAEESIKFQFSDWFIEKAGKFGGIEKIDEYSFCVIIFNRVHEFLVGSWNHFKYNSALTLFLTYQCEENSEVLNVGMKKEERMNLQNTFIDFLEENGAKTKGWGGSINKFDNLRKFLQSLRVITNIRGQFQIFGDQKFNIKFVEYILNNLNSVKTKNDHYLIEDFLKFIDNKFFCLLQGSKKIPKKLEDLLLSLNNTVIELTPGTGELRVYKFSNDKSYSFIKQLGA